MSAFEPLWEFDGYPEIVVEQAAVSHAGQSWLQRRIVVSEGRGGVVVLPVSGDDVTFVRLWRPVVDELRLELSRGISDGPDPEVEAYRELAEETGLVPTSMRRLGHFDLDSGLVPTPITVFEAIIDDREAKAETDGEIDEVVWIPRDKIAGLMADGTLCDGITLAAIALWLTQS